MTVACLEKLRVHELYEIYMNIDSHLQNIIMEVNETNRERLFNELNNFIGIVFERKTAIRTYDKVR